MFFNKVAVKYASTLYSELGCGPNAKTVYEDIEGILEIFSENENLARIIASPVFGNSQKLAVLLKIFRGRVDESIVRFIEFLGKKERLSLTREIFMAFLEVADKELGYKRIELASAFKLDDEEVEMLKKELEGYFNCKLKVNVIEDAGIIGGFLAKTDEVVVDASVKNQLEKLRKRFSAAGVSLNKI